MSQGQTFAAVAATLHRALKTKPCACVWHWCEQGYVVKTLCAGCKAIAEYEALTGRGLPS